VDNLSESGRHSSRPLSAFRAGLSIQSTSSSTSESFSDVLSRQVKEIQSERADTLFSRKGSLVEQAIRSRHEVETPKTKSSFASWLLGL
jgi:hypothetical protein